MSRDDLSLELILEEVFGADAGAALADRGCP
jgi:hypothetical protein